MTLLSHFLTSQLFVFLMIFCRFGSALMLMPGFGEAYVASRIRLLLALMFSLMLTPVIHGMPTPPATVFGLLNVMLPEMLVGIFLGMLSRMLISVMHITGTIVAFQSSLASSLTLDITQFSGQDTSLGNLFGMSALVLLFATDLDHLMLKGLADSYTLFLPGQFPPIGDLAQHTAHTMSSVFAMAMRLSAPNIAVGMMLYLGAGILSRLMPNMQIFFILMSPQILISFCVLMISFSAIMMWYLDFFKTTLETFLVPAG